MSIKFRGLADFERQLKKLERKLAQVSGTHEVPIGDLLNPAFMSRFSNFSSIEELFESGGFEFESQAEFDAIDASALDAHVAANTQFATWFEFFRAAADEYVQSKLAL